MQGQEASEQETKVESSVGIDVSKDWLDVHVRPGAERFRVANTHDGIRRLQRRLTRLPRLGLVAVEATGKWHRELRRSLYASGIRVAEVDPYRVRHFARAAGILAKTDRLDAAVLADYAATMAPAVRPPPAQALEELAELVTARDSAVAERTTLKNQKSAASVAFLRRRLEVRLAAISKEIDLIEEEIAKRIQADAELSRRYRILTSIPSIGFVVASTLIARLAELGSLSDKPIALLAGLAPIADQSGKREGVRVVWGGRGKVRNLLYMAAVTAKRCNSPMTAFYNRLTSKNGTAHKAAIIAIARKLVILANRLISQDRLWTPNPPKYA